MLPVMIVTVRPWQQGLTMNKDYKMMLLFIGHCCGTWWWRRRHLTVGGLIGFFFDFEEKHEEGDCLVENLWTKRMWLVTVDLNVIGFNIYSLSLQALYSEISKSTYNREAQNQKLFDLFVLHRTYIQF
jgi:hypothetical protein